MSPGSSDTADHFTRVVKDFVVSQDLILPAHRVLAAVSGGADSMALLVILDRLSDELGFSLAAGHFNHRLRRSAEDELARVRDFSASLGLAFYSGAEDVQAIVESTGDSVEEAARKARYRFLERTADEIGADRIATGHTRSDHIETVLMRMLRGTGLRGLAGIPARRGRIVRPLLCLTRANTVSCCGTHGISYVDDASNRDLRFFRNRVRHELLPLLEAKYDGRIQDNLARLARNAQSLIDTIRMETRPLIGGNFRRTAPGTWMLDTSEITRLDDTALVVLFGDVFAEELSCDMDFKRVHYEGLVRLVRDTRATGKKLSLPGLTVAKEHGRLVITRHAAIPAAPRLTHHTAQPRDDTTQPAHDTAQPTPPTALRLPGETVRRGLVITTEVLDRSTFRDRLPEATEKEAYFDMRRVVLPIFVRHPVRGDRMQPFGMTGTKKLSDIFIDKKIPVSSRATSLVITDTRDILWLVGVATSEKCRVDAATREIVRIRVGRVGGESMEGIGRNNGTDEPTG
jgi:tRNA(Ile)-lysidine synthase